MSLLVLLGVRRSGNHAIIGWIYGMLEGQYVHFNDLKMVNLDRQKYDQHLTDENIDRQNRPFFKDHHFAQFNAHENLLLSLENRQVKPTAEKLVAFKDVNPKIVVIMRHPFNMIASVYQFMKTNRRLGNQGIRKSMVEYRELWKDHAREITNQTNYFADNGLEYVFVLFDRWHVDKQYRQELAQKMGLKYNERNKDKIIRYGNSSFNQGQRNAQKLDVLNRYQLFEDDQLFQELINDDELKKLWEKILLFSQK